MSLNPGPTLHGSTIQEIAAERDSLRSQLATLQARCEAAEREVAVETRRRAQAIAERDREREICVAVTKTKLALTTERDAARAEVEQLKQTVKAFITAKDSTAREFNGLVNDIAAGVRNETVEQIADFVGECMGCDPPGTWVLIPRRIRAGAWRKEQP